jgi:hypothetical protein
MLAAGVPEEQKVVVAERFERWLLSERIEQFEGPETGSPRSASGAGGRWYA